MHKITLNNPFVYDEHLNYYNHDDFIKKSKYIKHS